MSPLLCILVALCCRGSNTQLLPTVPRPATNVHVGNPILVNEPEPGLTAQSGMQQASRLEEIMQMVLERVGALEVRGQQHTRILHTLENRMTGLSVSADQREETLRTLASEVERKMDNVEFGVGQLSLLVDVARQDVRRLERGHTDILVQVSSRKEEGGSAGRAQQSNSLQRMRATLHSLRGAVGDLQETVITLTNSTAQVLNVSREIEERSRHLPTASYLNTALDDTCSGQRTSPIYYGGHSPPQDNVTYPINCAEVLLADNFTESGLQQVRPRGAEEAIFVWCDMDTDGGGWTVIQNRYEGSQEFYRTWREYERGFGNQAGEFWLGNGNIHLLTTSQLNELRVELGDFSGNNAVASYRSFAVGSEKDKYSLKVLGEYDGEAGDSLSYHAGLPFSTYDNDNDMWEEGNCAAEHRGGWWYSGCDTSNLNGPYRQGAVPEDMQHQCMYWYDWRGPTESLAKSRMMIRPKPLQKRGGAATT